MSIAYPADSIDDIREGERENIADILYSALQDLPELDEGTFNPYPGDQKPGIKFRVRFHESTLYLHIGAPGYDRDHRGTIEAGEIPRGSSLDRTRQIVDDTIGMLPERRATREA